MPHMKVFAVTGSCGKSSATGFLGTIMRDCAPGSIWAGNNDAAATFKNMLKARRSHLFLVQELGVAKPGDMAKSIAFLRPNIGVVTTIGQDHYKSFRTLEATATEKGVLIESLPQSGFAVLNADDPHVLGMAGRTGANQLTYGLSKQADVRATEISSVWPQRLALTVTFQGESVRIETDLFGDLLATSLLAAVAGALAAGVSLQQCAASLQGVMAFPRRMSIHQNSQGSWFINDTYKAPYWGVNRFVSQVKLAMAPRKTLIFGTFSDMPGSDSPKYRSIARLGLAAADRVVFVGKKAPYIKQMITQENETRLFAFDSVRQALRLLEEDVVENELIFLKSNNIEHLERLTYGRLDGQNCWKETCKKTKSCDMCDERGRATESG